MSEQNNQEKPQTGTSQNSSQQSEKPQPETVSETVTVVTEDGEPEDMTWAEFREWRAEQKELGLMVKELHGKFFPVQPDPQNPESTSRSVSEVQTEEPKSKLPKGFFSNLKR